MPPFIQYGATIIQVPWWSVILDDSINQGSINLPGIRREGRGVWVCTRSSGSPILFSIFSGGYFEDCLLLDLLGRSEDFSSSLALSVAWKCWGEMGAGHGYFSWSCCSFKNHQEPEYMMIFLMLIALWVHFEDLDLKADLYIIQRNPSIEEGTVLMSHGLVKREFLILKVQRLDFRSPQFLPTFYFCPSRAVGDPVVTAIATY